VSGALAVDMESGWLTRGLGDRPVAVVRAVVDTVDRPLLSPSTVPAGIRALRAVRRAASVLEYWAGTCHPRRVLLAGPRSFCAGVERAIDIVERALDRYGAPVYVRRQIVHNTHVVEALEARGAVFVEELSEVPNGACVVLAAHGVGPEVYADAEARSLDVIDATCPLVAKVHLEARRFARDGYGIVLVGHADHEEVQGTIGEAPDVIQVVDSVEAARRVDVRDRDRVAFLTQTTLAVDEVQDIVGALGERFPSMIGPRAEDVCYATQNRQEAVRALAPECDLILVVGSRNSSNSNRLVEVAERHGCRARLIEDAGDLDLDLLHGVSTVGITAGASAPESLVDGVVEVLATLGPVEVVEREVVRESMHFALPVEVR
jgi:4-hydroxy-3-methylbut-2-enyl diphosphate reductase